MDSLRSIFLALKTDQPVGIISTLVTISLTACAQPAEHVRLNQLGAQAYLREDFGAAEAFFCQALAQHVEAPEDLARIHSNVAALYKHTGRYHESAAHYSAAARNREQLDPAAHAVTLNNLAEVRRLLNQPREAIRLFRQALRILDDSGTAIAFDRAVIANNLGVALGEQGRFTEGAQYLEAALDLKRQLFPPAHAQLSLTQSNLEKLRKSARKPSLTVRHSIDAMEFQSRK